MDRPGTGVAKKRSEPGTIGQGQGTLGGYEALIGKDDEEEVEAGGGG